MASSRAVIPRFLLPLQSPLWRGIAVRNSKAPGVRVRYASTNSSNPQKPIVLEQPARFNPPSHGSRLKKNTTPKHYGPALTSEEIATQNKRHYPGMMAPEGSWSHWFWHSRLLHTFITMGTLFAMGVYTFFMNYAYNSPYKELVPAWSDLWTRPGYFIAAWKEVIVSHEKDKAIKAGEHRARHIDDVAKRQYYMKMHGIEAKDPVAMVFGKDEGKSEAELEATALGRELPPKTAEELAAAAAEKPRKKWFGIF